MKIAVIGPVYNEAQFLPYSIMAVHPYVEEFVYAVSPKSDDGTIEMLRHIAKTYGKVRILLQSKYDFDPLDMKAYDASFNDCIEQSHCDAMWFHHMDMVVTNPEKIAELKEGPLAWTVNMTSYARDMRTVITKGRAEAWKNLHAKKLGLHYAGGYGSLNEDFYHSDITGKSYRHFGTNYHLYPYEIADSGINVNHYSEVKPYKRRLEKMKTCLKTQHPNFTEEMIEELAVNHPRVTLEQSSQQFGRFDFEKTQEEIPEVFARYKEEFAPFQKIKEAVYG